MSEDDTNEVDSESLVAAQASHWWAILHAETATAAHRRAFGDWISRSPERIAAYLRTERFMRAVQRERSLWPDTAAADLVAKALAEPATVVALPRARRRKSAASASVRAPIGVAAILLIAVAASWWFMHRPKIYETAFGEQRSVMLDDGSLVTLNTASRIAVEFEAKRRLVRLLQGEVLFHVAHQADRPFDVVTGEAVLRAVGTQFNVDRRPFATTVTVVEGRVAVFSAMLEDAARSGDASARVLGAAQRAVVKESQVGRPERVSNVEAVTAWTQWRLVFERRALSEVADEFNRYNRQVIEIDGENLRRQQITGTFQANDTETFIGFLSQIPGVRVEATAHGHRVAWASIEGAKR